MRSALVVRLVQSFGSLATLCTLAFGGVGCGSDGGDGPAGDASPIVTDDGASDGATPDGEARDTAPFDAGPQLCWLAHSNDSSASTCDKCSQKKCADRWASTWGPGWATDDFGGACAKDATCECACDEEDLVCIQNCDVTYEGDACRTEKQALYDCETANCSVECGRSF